MPSSLLTTKNVTGEVDYQSKEGNVKENFMVDFMASKIYAETVQRSELFVDGSAPYSTYRAFDTSHANRLKAKNNFHLTVPNKIYTDLGIEFTYNKYKGNSEALSEDFLDRINTRLRSTNYNDGYSYGMDVGGFISPRIDNFLRPLALFYGFKHNEDKNESARGFVTEQFVVPSTLTQYNANDFRRRETLGNFHLVWNSGLGEHLSLELQDRQEFSKKYERDHLYHPDTLTLPSQLDALTAITDPRNSYESVYRNNYNAPTIALKWRKGLPGDYMPLDYIYWEFRISNIISSERLTYTRNNTTQNKERTSYEFTPTFNFQIRPTKKQGEKVQLQLRYTQGAANIFDLLDYRDDATPQVVKLGNPGLKGPSSTTARISFTDQESQRKGQQYNLQGSFSYFHRQVAQSVIFNPGNSQYTYQPKNVSGAYEATAQFDFTRFLDKRQRWSWQTRLNAAYNHSIDHVMQTGMKESTPNAVNTLNLQDGLWLQYQLRDFSVKAIGDICWRHSEGKMDGFATLDAFDYQYGMAMRYTMPVVKTTLSADWNMYCRRGYGNSALNTSDFVMNASVSQPFLKGKLIASVEAFDLFHQLSSTQYTVNAQGRTETWNRTLPNYVMLHMVYHFNKQPKQ